MSTFKRLLKLKPGCYSCSQVDQLKAIPSVHKSCRSHLHLHSQSTHNAHLCPQLQQILWTLRTLGDIFSIKFTVQHLQSRPQAFAEEEGSLQFLQKVGKRLR